MNLRVAFQQISTAMNAAIIGQETVVERLLIAFLTDGHVLMEGLPGVARTGQIKTLSKLVESAFRRVQFTPDLLRAGPPAPYAKRASSSRIMRTP